MKIAIITPSLHYGGGEKQVEFLALGLKLRGHSVTVYCFADEGEIAGILREDNIKVVALFSRTLKKSGPDRFCRIANELWAACRLLFIFLADSPEVVHLYQNQTKMAILVSRLAGVKRIIYTETSSIGDWMSPFKISIMRLFWKLCDTVIVLSEAMKEHMVELKAVDVNKIYLAPTMLPIPERILGMPDNSRKDTLNVGIIGRLTPGKGHPFFLTAASLIVKTRKNIKFIIAGGGHLKDELIEKSKNMGLENSVEFTGAFKDVSEVMCRIDILVLSSLTEGLPLVLLEGMAYGKPIVATDVGGVRELVLNGITGLLVMPKDAEALARAILILADNSFKRKTFADEAAKRFVETYSSEIVIPKIESAYRRKNVK
jgi:glycosyltransferase involved in cell wall biosynthesis